MRLTKLACLHNNPTTSLLLHNEVSRRIGNIGDEYQGTRHNIGFAVLDALAKRKFRQDRHAFVAEYKFKARTFILIKPTTFMNLVESNSVLDASGKDFAGKFTRNHR